MVLIRYPTVFFVAQSFYGTVSAVLLHGAPDTGIAAPDMGRIATGKKESLVVYTGNKYIKIGSNG